jgi:hypothetical protein
MEMKNYTLNLTEEEMLYIRTALCNKNLKHTVKVQECRINGDKLGEEFNMERHEIGVNILNRIDSMREC